MGLKRTRKRPGPRKRRQATYAALKNKLDAIFSLYVRKRDFGKGCISCGMLHGNNGYQAGHYISRVHLSTRWDERNVNAQCMPCNVWRRGNAGEYTLGLQAKYGPDIIKELVDLKHQTVKFNRSDLEAKIEEFRIRLNNLSNG
jgi:hypothetical protein